MSPSSLPPSPTLGQRLLGSLTFSRLFFISAILRITLIVYSEWHDAHSVVKYTDVDYRVFSDAARFLLNPSGIYANQNDSLANGVLGRLLGVGDPYCRATYRYTPLLALLLAPNEWLHPAFGKCLFAACDLAAGFLMYHMLVRFILPRATNPASSLSPVANEISSGDEEKTQGKALVPTVTAADRATLLTAVHLLNPLVFSISTRGSSESVLSLFVLASLYYALEERWDAAAVILGLATHWKIYPFVYGVACLGVIGGQNQDGGQRGRLCKLLTRRTIRFTCVSASTFAALGVVMYLVWGYPFLYHSYLYHLHRLDHRHNFSPYFYLIYLTYPTSYPTIDTVLSVWQRIIRSPLASFIPQMTLTLGAGFLFGRNKRNLPFAWFVQTFTFVVFNKVCTSQYFLWYTLFIPLLVPFLHMSLHRALCVGLVWTGTQALWLAEAYKLEFLGEDVFFGLWLRGLVYLIGHTWVLSCIIDSYRE